MKYIILAILAALTLTACGPSTFEECILENLKSGQNKDAVYLIEMACEATYPKAVETGK